MSSYYEKFADGTVRCIDDEIPFDIPESWEWCRIRNISQSYIGLTYSPSDVNNEGVIVLRSSNIQNGTIDLSDLIRVSKEIPEKLKVEKNDIVICARNGSAKLVGKSAIIREIVEPMTFGAFMAICKTSLYEYVYTFLQSDIFFGQLRGVSSTTTINQLTQNNFNNFLIPIPPKEEQARICNNIAVVLPFIEQYGRKQEALSQLDKNVKEHLRKSLLQEAIQGRLVPQIEEEGTAAELLEEIRIEKGRLVKEGKLKASAFKEESCIFKGEDNKYYEQIGSKVINISSEIPFEIPKSWRWCRISSIFQINPKNVADDATEVAFVPMELVNPGYGSGFTFQLTQWKNVKRGYTHFADGDIAFAKITPCFQNRKSVIFNGLPNGIGAGTTELRVLRSITNRISSEYVLAFLQSPYFIDDATFKGTANQQRIINGYVENKLFPLPPIEEQQRISQLLEEISKMM